MVKFQSAPDISVGRTELMQSVFPIELEVSIRARHLCQANRQDYYLLPGAAKFQSAPDISVGRTRRIPPVGCSLRVSIRARHLCRANHERLHIARPQDGFNPRPTSLSGEPGRSRHR